MTQKSINILPMTIGLIVIVMVISPYSKQAIAFCIEDSVTCVEGAETRLINGHPVTQDCWRYTSQYTCDGTTAIADAHCQELVDQGCSPLSQVCDEDSCVQTYECITGTTQTQQGVGCDSQSVTVGGLDFDSGYQANTDFGLAAANMAAIESAVTGMIKNDASCFESPPGSGEYVCADPISIFSGQDRMCRKDSLGFNQCCNLSGWGTDLGLNQCNADEYALGYARQDGRTHYVGRYCRHSNIFGCYAHGYVYCEFTSKIGRIIQEQGRAQLGIGWGSPTAPNCRGLSEVELATVNFDLIDFSEYFGDAFADMTNPPTNSQMESIVNSYINRLQNAGCSQFDTGCVGDF